MKKFKKINNVLNSAQNKIFDFWEVKPYVVNFLCVIPLLLLYIFGWLDNIRENTSSVISYAGALITINGVFLTLLVTLKESPIFLYLRKRFPVIHNYLYTGLRRQIRSAVILIIINLAIGIVGVVENKYLAISGLIVWSYYLIDVSIGAIYNLKVVTNLATKKFDDDETPLT